MQPNRSSAALAALLALAACSQAPSESDTPAPDLSKKARVVTFDVSGMT